MVKGFKLLFVLTLVSGFISFSNGNEGSIVNAAIDATNADAYYSSLYDSNGNIKYTGDELLDELNKLISSDTTNKSYDYLDTIYETSDIDPNNSNNVILYYTGESRAYNFSGFSGTINREHVWPQSHFGASQNKETSPYSDAHHVRPCDSSLNSSRGNSYFDELTNGSTDKYGNMWSGGIFYPSEAYRGDAARICFYVAARYTNLSFTDNASTGNTGQNLQMGNLSALLKWNEEYKVSASEIRRNNAVAKIQNNRNPFIDHPEFAEYIWGDGSFDGGDNEVAYSVVFKSMGGSEVASQEVKENGYIVKPNDPTKDGYTFGGWYLDSACTMPYDFSNKVTNSVTLYAKWILNSTEDFNELDIYLTAEKQGFANGNEVTKISSDPVTLTFSKSKGTVTPKYYSSGDAVRLYGGNTLTVSSTKPMKSITLSFGSGDGSNQITVNNGSFLTPLWSASNEETTSVTFSISGTSGNRRVQKISIEFVETKVEVDLSDVNIYTALSFSYSIYGVENQTPSYSFDNFSMRYKVDIDKDVFESIDAVSYGALINYKENNPSYNDMMVEEFNNTYTQDNQYEDINMSSEQIIKNESTYTLSATFTNISNADLEKEIVTAFYIKTEDKVYFTGAKTYSVSSLVDEYLEKYQSELTEEEIEFLTILDSSIN